MPVPLEAEPTAEEGHPTATSAGQILEAASLESTGLGTPSTPALSASSNSTPTVEIETETQPPQITIEEAIEKAAVMEPAFDTTDKIESDHLFCPDCYLPLHPDPNPEKLYIFLHALKYTTSLGEFSTEMPEWAAEGWFWDQS